MQSQPNENTVRSGELTTFLDQSKILPEQVFPAQKTTTGMANFALPAIVGSFNDAQAKDSHIINVTWSTADAAFTSLAHLRFPQAFRINPQRMLLDNYGFVAADLVIRIQFNGTPFHQGRLIVYWSPIHEIDASIYRATGMPSVEIDAATNITQEITIPYAHLFSAINTYGNTSIDKFGTLVIKVMNVLQTEAEPTLGFFVYARMENVKSYNPGTQHVYNPPFLAQSGKTHKNVSSRKPNPILDTVTEVTSAVSNAVSLASTIGEMFLNLDNPNLPLPIAERVTDSVIHGSGGTQAIRLDLNQNARISQPSVLFHTLDDEMDIKNLIRLPSLFKQIVWNAADPAGTLLMNIPFSPISFRDTIGPGHYDPSILNYFSYAFQKWRGDIELTFDIVANGYHRGQLLFVHIAAQNDNPTPFADALANPQGIYDLKTSHTFKQRVSYTATTAEKLCPPVLGFSATPTELHACGYINLYVLNALAAGASSPPRVEINIKVNACENFEFLYPRSVPRFVAQSEGTSQDAISDATSLTRVANADVAGATLTGSTAELPLISYMNVKELCGRPQFRSVLNNIPTAGLPELTRILNFVNGLDDQFSSLRVRNSLQFFGQCYMFLRGGLRLYLLTDFNATDNVLLAASVNAPTRELLVTDSTLVVEVFNIGESIYFTHGGVKPLIVLDTPYMSTFNHVFATTKPGLVPDPAYSSINSVKIYSKFVDFQQPQPATRVPYVLLYQSLADDARFSYFVGVPRMFNSQQ